MCHICHEQGTSQTSLATRLSSNYLFNCSFKGPSALTSNATAQFGPHHYFLLLFFCFHIFWWNKTKQNKGMALVITYMSCFSIFQNCLINISVFSLPSIFRLTEMYQLENIIRLQCAFKLGQLILWEWQMICKINSMYLYSLQQLDTQLKAGICSKNTNIVLDKWKKYLI